MSEPKELVTPRMLQEMDMMCQQPPFRMLQRHIVAAHHSYDSPKELAIPLASALAGEFLNRLLAATKEN